MRKYDVFHCYDKRVVMQSEYVVQKGDTLYKIATNHGVSLEELKAANNLTNSLIYPGQIIIIPKSVPSGSIYFEEYTIQPDDTMEKIAMKLGIDLELLTKYNDVTKLLLAENQIIRIPRAYNTYVITNGDTLEAILTKFNMTLEELVKANMDMWLAPGTIINVR